MLSSLLRPSASEPPASGAGVAAQMIRRLFGRRSRLSIETAAVPPHVRVYAIGDVHGRVDLLRQLHALILADAAHAVPGTALQAVYLGDYVDRGLHSREVIDLLLNEPLPGCRSIYLRGNHDQQFLDFLAGPAAGPAWLRFGGDATIYSYGVRVPDNLTATERLERMWSELRQAVPARHVAFLQGLRFAYEIGDYAFVHAGVDPEKPLAQQTRDDLLWIRDAFLDSDCNFGRVIVHGHSVSRDPDVRRNRIGIDTGACYSNRLTCLVLEGRSRRFLTTRPA
jgi:serine/threonine protein phosphatase 1